MSTSRQRLTFLGTGTVPALLAWPAVTDDGSVLNEEGTDGRRPHRMHTHRRQSARVHLPAPPSTRTSPLTPAGFCLASRKEKKKDLLEPGMDNNDDARHRIISLQVVYFFRVMHLTGGCARIFLLFRASGLNFLQQLQIAAPGLVVLRFT